MADSEIQTAVLRTTKETRITKAAADSEIQIVDHPQTPEVSEIQEAPIREEQNLPAVVSAVAVSETAQANKATQTDNKTVAAALDRTIINNDYK